jgi:hypothetical protein
MKECTVKTAAPERVWGLGGICGIRAVFFVFLRANGVFGGRDAGLAAGGRYS